MHMSVPRRCGEFLYSYSMKPPNGPRVSYWQLFQGQPLQGIAHFITELCALSSGTVSRCGRSPLGTVEHINEVIWNAEESL